MLVPSLIANCGTISTTLIESTTSEQGSLNHGKTRESYFVRTGQFTHPPNERSSRNRIFAFTGERLEGCALDLSDVPA
jgi:hypothetical protein